MLTWRTLKHELAREVATQSRGARQKPPDHEVGNTVRNDRGFVDVGIGTHKRHTRDAEATASAHNKALAVKRQGAGCARRAGRHCRDSSRHSSVPRGHKRARGHQRERGREGPGGGMQGHCAAHDGHEWGGQNSPSWRETRTERARGLGCGTELVCATSRCGARECTRHRAPRCAARWGVCVWGHLLQKHRCLDSGRVRGRARRVARALVASVGACDTRGVWRTRVPRPCTCSERAVS